MKKTKKYLLTTIILLAPALLLAHPGHEHHGTGMELLLHSLVSIVLITALGAGLFYLVRSILRRKKSVGQNPR